MIGDWVLVISVPITSNQSPVINHQNMSTTQLPGDTSLPSSPKELKKLIKADKGKYKYSVEDFFKNPEKTGYQLSPDGKYFSYLAPYLSLIHI